MSREEWIREKRREATRLQGVATNAIVPSARDFAQFLASQRSDLALVPRLKRRDPLTGGSWPGADFAALAVGLDDTEIAALAVCTSEEHGCTGEDLETVRTAMTAPLLRDDLCFDEVQVFDSRIRGADAVRIPISELDSLDIERVSDISVSLHMTPVLEIADEADLEKAPMRAPHCVGINCVAADGFADLARVRILAGHIPRFIVVVLLAEVRSIAEGLTLRGDVDAVVVGDSILDAASPLDEVDRFFRR